MRPVSPIEAVLLGALGGFVTAVAFAAVAALVFKTKPPAHRKPVRLRRVA